MSVVATFNLKGGVGKTATAVNLAYLATRDGARTLLWDLDAQGATSYYLRVKPRVEGGAALIEDKHGLARAIRATDYSGLDLIAADYAYRNLDLDLHEYKKGHQRLARLLRDVRSDYEYIFIDCAPSMSLVAENIASMADVLLVPLIPTHLSLRAYAQLQRFVSDLGGAHAELVPFFSMVDRRRRLHCDVIVQFAREHREVLASFVPYASDIERMGEHRAPVNVFADRGVGGRAFRALWDAVKARLGTRAAAGKQDRDGPSDER
jgi:cellulose biosynthesis protein BcsQ